VRRTLERTVLPLLGAVIGLGGIAIAAGRLVAPLLDHADVSASLDMAAARGQAGIDLAEGVSRLGALPAVVLLTAVAAIGLLRARQRLPAIFVATATLGAIALTEIVKAAVARPRPSVALPADELSRWSFPSGHATEAAALYLALALVLAATVGSRRQAIAAVAAGLGLAVLVGTSRFYLGAHYPTDVAAGLMLGSAWTLLCWTILRRLPSHG
jgi:undecaprenyl-diphosphatase